MIAHEVNPPDRSDRDRITDQLSEVYDQLCGLYGLLVEEAMDAMNPHPKAGDPIVDDDRYTDGSWIWTVRPPDRTSFPVQAAIYCGDLGPDLPPGCEVIVADPAHRRKPKARAAGRDGDTDVEALKTLPARSAQEDIMIPYPTGAYKKYTYAIGVHPVRRLYDSVGGLDLDLETSDDVT